MNRVATLAACLAALAGCRYPASTCAEPIHAGDTIRVALLEPYSSTSAYTWDAAYADRAAGPTCAGSDALAPGVSFELRLANPFPSTALACAPLHVYPVDPSIPSIAFQPENLDRGVSDIGQGTVGFKHIVGQLPTGCVTGWDFVVQASEADPFARAVPGHAPPATVHRRMASTAAGCPATCQDLWVAQLDRVSP